MHGVRYAATAVSGRTAYVFGGEVLGRELGTVQAVDLATGRTRVVARLPVPLGHAMAATVGGRMLLMGGRVAPDRQTAAMWWFDPASGPVHPRGPAPDGAQRRRGRGVRPPDLVARGRGPDGHRRGPDNLGAVRGAWNDPILARLSAVRRAKIVCTLGPAVDTPEKIRELVDAGMDVARLNMSHGTHDDHRRRYDMVRAASDATGHGVGIIADLQGPKIRLETFADGKAKLAKGAEFVITTRDVEGDATICGTTYKGLPGRRVGGRPDPGRRRQAPAAA